MPSEQRHVEMDVNEISNSFLEVSEYLLGDPQGVRSGAIWDYELRMETWLYECYGRNIIPVAKRIDIEQALTTIYRDSETTTLDRFNAYYCHLMHLVNAGDFAAHSYLLRSYGCLFDSPTDSFPYCMVEHRRTYACFQDAKHANDGGYSARHALNLSQKSLESDIFREIPGVANVYANIVAFMVETRLVSIADDRSISEDEGGLLWPKGTIPPRLRCS